MEMVAFSFLEMLVLLAGSSGLPATDLASLLAADDYFSARNVTLNTKEMTALAGKEASDAKEEIQQLVAIRWLGENPAATKKDPAAREMLEQIAAGKKGRDRHGFAKAHALQALARLDGKPVPPMTTMPDSSLLDALGSFPSTMTLAGGMEIRPGKTVNDTILDTARKLLLKNIHEKDRKQAYDVVDSIGNIRIDRLAGAIRFEDNGRPNGYAASISGVVDSERFASFLVAVSKGRAKVVKKKGPGGETLRLFDLSENGGPSFAFVNDSEVIFAGVEQGPELIEKVLRIRSEKKGSVVDGPYAKLLKGVPTQARLLGVGELPEEARKELTRGKSPLRAVPKQFVVHATQGEKQMTLELKGSLKDRDEAQAFADGVLGLKQMALKELDNIPPEARVPKEIVKRVKDALGALKAESDGSTTTLKSSFDSMAVLGDLLLWLLRVDNAPPPPPR
jgi:hypothetical protein